MAMSIGGDDSVAWTATHATEFEIEFNQAKRTLHSKHPERHAVNMRNLEGYAEGRDPGNTDGKYFQITIKVPAGDAGGRFLQKLRTAANNGVVGGTVAFQLPIVRQSYDQINVDWPMAEDNLV